MATSPAIPVRFRFERVDPAVEEYLAGAARSTLETLRRDPLTVINSPLGRSSRAATGLLASADGPADPRATQQEAVRLRAIEGPDGCLVEYSADPATRTLTSTWCDGQTLRNEFNADGKLLRVRLGNTHHLDYLHTAEGRCQRLSYGPAPAGSATYRWSANDHLAGVDLPYGWINYQRDPHGPLVGICADRAVISLSRQDGKRLTSLELAAGDARLAFALPSGSSKAETTEGPSGNMTVTLSPMGIHTIDASGRVVNWLRWDGQYLYFAYRPDGCLRRLWGVEGPTVLEHTTDGQLTSLLTPEGGRWLVHRARSQELIVRSDSVVLVRRDDDGRPRALLGSWGTFVTFGYGLLGRSQLPTTIRSPRWGTLQIGYDRQYRVTSVAAANKGRVSLRYDGLGKLTGVSYQGKHPADVAEFLLLAGWLYCLRTAGSEAYRESLLWSLSTE